MHFWFSDYFFNIDVVIGFENVIGSRVDYLDNFLLLPFIVGDDFLLHGRCEYLMSNSLVRLEYLSLQELMALRSVEELNHFGVFIIDMSPVVVLVFDLF